MSGFRFPKWADALRLPATVLLVGGPVYLIALGYYGFWPRTRVVGYTPKQPVPYSHALHAGELGMDCRYCHTTVEQAPGAAIPPTQTCMNCHNLIRSESPKLLPVRESYATGNPIEWVRVHSLPDFVYFNHSAHVRRGVSCVSCHGRVDQMEEVTQVKPLSMGFCLNCHRDPEPHLRPAEYVTKLDWVPNEDPRVLGKRLAQANNIHPSTDCSTCHR